MSGGGGVERVRLIPSQGSTSMDMLRTISNGGPEMNE